MDLKTLLGDKYDEISNLIGDYKLIIDDGRLIPKYRFDEINNKYKDSVAEISKLKETNETNQAQIESLCAQIEEIKSGYEKSLNILRVKEIFVDGGLTEKDYKEIVEYIVHGKNDGMMDLAKCIVKVIKNKSNEK